MKYMNRIAGVMLTIFLFVTACSNGGQIKEISHIGPGAFKKYTGTYVGSNSDVFAIVKNLSDGVTSIGDYLFLEIEQGKEQIEELHDKLYTGPLLPFLRKDIPYIPHVTVGRKESSQLATKLAKDIPSFHEKLNGIIDRISVERIGENGESIIEFEVFL
ncbi:hypothetical protein QUG02_13900 [Bacillus hominis]|uniref:2'-5' RNA ligase family protein n=1 Tax=Bacillus hominis TaxID=2817478 RepID=A0ABT7R8D0_9BACI|nr:2'-5' RNA ligase family protein [Bacillus hominis]MDM5194062.1 hypothetical protein [Bacillus hominis]MDM5433767.1 hypothetical protein [Bacillus hominis]MDM5439189.1 hypothetical protein [Bacillus hominis]